MANPVPFLQVIPIARRVVHEPIWVEVEVTNPYSVVLNIDKLHLVCKMDDDDAAEGAAELT